MIKENGLYLYESRRNGPCRIWNNGGEEYDLDDLGIYTCVSISITNLGSILVRFYSGGSFSYKEL